MVKDKAFWEWKWEIFEKRLRQAAHLDDETECTAANKAYYALKLRDLHSAVAASAFLEEYVEARGKMLVHELLDDNQPKMVIQEIELFKSKTEGSDMLKFLQGMADFRVGDARGCEGHGAGTLPPVGEDTPSGRRNRQQQEAAGGVLASLSDRG